MEKTAFCAGSGTGGIHVSSSEEIEEVIRRAIENGINFFDLCCSDLRVYDAIGKAIKDHREKISFQLHFGAVYNEKGEYGWSTDLPAIQSTFDYEMKALGTDYVDFGMIHCVDEIKDFEQMKKNGVIDFILDLKKKGILHHIGFSSHTSEVAQAILDKGYADLMMFSINPAYDYECGRDELGIGSTSERMSLFQRCQKDGIGISVMKPFYAGKLLSEKDSPFHVALSHAQCLQYALDQPGVPACVPGVRNLKDLNELLQAAAASDEEKDDSILGSVSLEAVRGTCVYCHHCQPCLKGIDIGLVNKYYDLALAGDLLAKDHYRKLDVKANACIQCGHCDHRCPFQVRQSRQ